MARKREFHQLDSENTNLTTSSSDSGIYLEADKVQVLVREAPFSVVRLSCLRRSRSQGGIFSEKASARNRSFLKSRSRFWYSPPKCRQDARTLALHYILCTLSRGYMHELAKMKPPPSIKRQALRDH